MIYSYCIVVTESVVSGALELQRIRGSGGLALSVTEKGSIEEPMLVMPQ
ncbi:MAG: hypothetical protein AAF702_42945 [Chloroflexota bacterium]